MRTGPPPTTTEPSDEVSRAKLSKVPPARSPRPVMTPESQRKASLPAAEALSPTMTKPLAETPPSQAL